MTLVISTKRGLGELHTLKQNTPYGFSRAMRSLLSVLMRVSEKAGITPEASLNLIKRHLTVSEFVPVPSDKRIDVTGETRELREFLDNSVLGRSTYLTEVCKVIVSLGVTNMFEVYFLFEGAAAMYLGTGEGLDVSITVNDNVAQTEKPTKQEVSKPLTPRQRRELGAKSATKQVQNKPAPVKKVDDVLNRSKATLAKSKETLAESGQTVTTNPLLSDFL